MNFVKIKKIELRNYRQYQKQTITFKDSPNRNIYIIEGRTGFGKSNIFNAITWCLFGTEQHLKPDERALPICNTARLKEGQPNDMMVETSVRIELDTDEGMKRIERKAFYCKQQDGKSYKQEPKLDIMEQRGQDWKINPFPEYIISRIVPKDMSHFFFIDGERLRQLFENINKAVIKQSIFDLSQITLLQKSIEHLDGLKREYRASVKGGEPQINLLAGLLEKFEKQIAEDKKRLEDLQADKEIAYSHKKQLDQEMQDISNEGLKVLEEQRKGAEIKISNLESKLEEKAHDYIKYLFKMAPIIITHKLMDKTLDVISKLESNHKLPPKVEATFLRELLAENRCICGRGIDGEEHTKAKEELERLLADAALSDVTNDTVTLRFQLKQMKAERDSFEKVVKAFEEECIKLERQLDNEQNNLKEIKTKIGNIDIGKVKRVHEEREKYADIIRECGGRIGQLKENINETEKKYKQLESSYDHELSKKKQYQRLNNRLQMCEKCIEYLTNIKEKIMREIKIDIEKKTKEYWYNLVSAKKFKDFTIEEDYELRVEKDGYNAVTTLSAGETLCLGYSFMSALRNASGFAVPIVIDTPLAKIDKEYRINVADWFKKVLKDAQVILLVTNAEYTTDFKEAIKESIAQEFLLRHNEQTGVSEVIENG